MVCVLKNAKNESLKQIKISWIDYLLWGKKPEDEIENSGRVRRICGRHDRRKEIFQQIRQIAFFAFLASSQSCWRIFAGFNFG